MDSRSGELRSRQLGPVRSRPRPSLILIYSANPTAEDDYHMQFRIERAACAVTSGWLDGRRLLGPVGAVPCPGVVGPHVAQSAKEDNILSRAVERSHGDRARSGRVGRMQLYPGAAVPAPRCKLVEPAIVNRQNGLS